MRKSFTILFVLFLTLLPCYAFAATVSGSLTQVLARSTKQLEKITITLEAQNGTSVQTATDKNGNYRFTGVNNGTYRITVQLPSDHVPAMMGDSNHFLPAQDNHAQTDWFQVDGNTEIDLASTRATVMVKFIAFVDENANGGRMNSEEDLRDVQVSLHPAGRPDITVASGVTNRNGELTLDNLSPADYQVKVIYPDNYSAGPLGSKVSQYYNCIIPTDSQEAWSAPFSLATGSQGIGIGAVITGSAQGNIWFDADASARKDNGESGLADVQVTLISFDNSLTRTTTTDSAGRYEFARLQPGEYMFKVTAPKGYMFTVKSTDNWLTSDDGDTAQGTVEVTAENTLRIPDVGLMRSTGLQVIFYQDNNANGTKEKDEPGYEGASLLITRNGKTVAQILSDASGVASIPIIRAGSIQAAAQLTEPQIFSPAGEQNDFALVIADMQSVIDVELPAGEMTTLYAAVTVPAHISGSLFMDSDNNGVRSAQETAAEGFSVQAVDWTGRIVAETVTDANGAYQFDQLLPIPHTIRFLLRDPYISSPYAENGNRIVDQNSDYGETAQLDLRPGSFTGSIDGGLFQAGTISGSVFLTEDHPVEIGNGLEGVTVTLITLTGEEVSDYTTVKSETDGSYYLKGILPGEYKLKYTVPEDSLFADTDDLSITSDSFTSSMGSDLRMPEVYAVRTATIEGQALCEGEPANAMITVANQETGYTVSFPAEAASGGHFGIHLLRPGHWNVTVTLEEGFSFAEDTDLIPAIAHNVSSKEYDLQMAEELNDQKILVTRPATMTGMLFLDEDLSGSRDEGEALFTGVRIALINRDGETAAELTTDENGYFESPKLIPGKYQVSLELENDCILLEGYQTSETQWAQDVEAVSGQNTDAAVPVLRFASISGKLWSLDESLDFVSGLEVQLFDAKSPESAISVTKTDRLGQYSFPRLYPGTYSLTVKLPEGHGFARRADTDETHVSLILSNDDSTMSDPIQLTMGVNITNADFGFGAKGSIGDLAWLDENGNGMQDIGEPGIPGIRIQLIQGDELLAETETDLYGHYMFEAIYPGHYTLRVTMHPELIATVHQDEFPLIGSVLPESDELTVDANDVIVPSGTRNLAVDIGFRLREEGKYPAVMDTIPTMDWSFGGKKR